MDQFNGFSETGLQFLSDLRDNNDREWFNARKDIYKSEIQAPAVDFIEDMGVRLKSISPAMTYDTRLNGSGSLMRIYRDTRFSKDKTPYKTNVGIVFWEGAGKKMENPGFYFHLNADEAWIGGGLYIFPKQVLASFREAVAEEKGGNALIEAMQAVQEQGYALHGDQYKRVPRGFDADHPRADLLRYKGLFTMSPQIARDVITSAELVEVCFEHCLAIAPLQQWFVKYAMP